MSTSRSRPPTAPPRAGERGASELVVFGRRGVREALAARAHVEVISVHLSRSLPRALRRAFDEQAREAGAPVESIRSDALSALTGEPRHDQGVAARVRLRRLMEIEGFLAGTRGAGARVPVRVLALDGLTNAQNVGMIVRSAVAAGMDAVLWPTSGTPWINGLVVKASAGTVLRCPIVRCAGPIDGLAALQAAGFEAIGLCTDAEETLDAHAPPHRAVYVVGSETHGLTGEVRGLLDRRIRIPMRGGVESLNAAVAASLVCFAVARVAEEPD